jgi:hypothetical protein
MKRRLLGLLLILVAVTLIPLPLLVREGVRLTHWLFVMLLLWSVTAYLLAPWIWRLYFRNHVTGAPEVTRTKDGHPGDPVNLAVGGTEECLIRAMTESGWHPADPITFRSSMRIVKDTVFRKPDNNAPVSALYLFKRKQDLAFELPVGGSPRQRHHVRFWQGDTSRWYGAATFDRSVGLSHTTGQVTHHIGPEIDSERDLVMIGLEKAGWVRESVYEEGFHRKLQGRNGGGDPWHTDGRLGVVTLRAGQHGSFPPYLSA